MQASASSPRSRQIIKPEYKRLCCDAGGEIQPCLPCYALGEPASTDDAVPASAPAVPRGTLSTVERSDMRRDDRPLMAGRKLHSRTSSCSCSRLIAAIRSCSKASPHNDAGASVSEHLLESANCSVHSNG